MSASPRIVLLNPTCLDALHLHREWIATLGVELVADEAVRNLQPQQVDSVLAGADALILPAAIRSLPLAEQMEQHRNLKILSIAAIGHDWLDVDAATRNGIVVTNAPAREGIEVVAELTLGLMIDVARQVSYHAQLLRTGGYERGMGRSLWGKTLGIVGLGNIGKAVARRATGFGMKLLAATPRPDREFIREHQIEVVALDDLLRRSDFVSLHTSLNAQTRGMIGKRELGLMKPTAFLINAARDALVDEVALTEALSQRTIAGAAMDDPPQRKDCPLLKLSNFLCTPHLGNRAIEGASAVFRCAMENAVAVLRGERPASVLNPAVYENPKIRICLNRREPR